MNSGGQDFTFATILFYSKSHLWWCDADHKNSVPALLVATPLMSCQSDRVQWEIAFNRSMPTNMAVSARHIKNIPLRLNLR
jgi:hypothetical protein